MSIFEAYVALNGYILKQKSLSGQKIDEIFFNAVASAAHGVAQL